MQPGEDSRGPVAKIAVSVLSLVLFLSGTVLAESEKGLEVSALAKSGSSWDGKGLPDYPRGRPEITILSIKIPPGARLPLHLHPVINAGVLVKGELTVVTEENKVLHLKAGDPIIEVVNTWHYGKNEKDEPAEIIVFYAGTEGTDVTIRK